MLKRIIPVLAGVLFFASLEAQTQRCGTDLHTEYMVEKDPQYALRMANANAIVEQWLAENGTDWRSGGEEVYTIPVVVHVLWKTASQNISDEQIQSQIDILNADFQRLNSDTSETPDGFKPVAGSLPLQFCLAQRDPFDEPTSGIERRETDVTTFDWTDDMKYYASGGLNAWDPTRYFNIWVCNLSSGLLGYAEFPTGTVSDSYGIAIDYLYTGNIGTATYPYNEGRTSTHEIGHCFNLRHIWGDDGSGCGGSDLVDDTPNQANENYGCPGFPETDACTPDGDGVMYMNYMDYTDDACMNMFTVGQADRMFAAIENFYPELLESNGCEAIDLFTIDAGVSAVSEPSGLYCETSVSPSATIRNWGDDVLTSVTINYSIDGGAAETYDWTGSLASLAFATVSLPAVTVSEGIHTMYVYTTNPNGTSDPNAINDTDSSSFSVFTSGTLTPITEGFEDESFPAGGWSLKNTDDDITWARTTAAASIGDASAWVDNYAFGIPDTEDDLMSIPLDLDGMTYPLVTFDVAYTNFKQGTTERNDALEVLVTTDCGNTYTSVYFKEGDDLSTRSPTSAAFTPTSSQWRTDSIDLTAYADEDFLSVVFRNISGGGNNLYIDNINIEQGLVPDGIITPLSSLMTIYPVPANDQLFMEWNSQVYSGRLQLIDLSGRTLRTQDLVGSVQSYSWDITDLPSGFYSLILVTDDGTTAGQKVLIQH